MVRQGKKPTVEAAILNLTRHKLTDNHAMMDFNTAYNPYCAYNPTLCLSSSTRRKYTSYSGESR